MRRFALIAAIFATFSGCVARPDYSAFFAHEPRSILVLPALNEVTEVTAQSVYATTVSRPLAERGYYVFPVVLTEALFQDLGLPEAGLIHQLPPERFRELFGADAVLYVTIVDWSNKYILLQSSTVVELSFVLKDTRTGTVLWEKKQSAVQSSGSGGGGLLGMAIEAAVTYAVNELIEIDYRPLAVQANQLGFATVPTGLPAGPYHPDYGKDRSNYGP